MRNNYSKLNFYFTEVWSHRVPSVLRTFFIIHGLLLISYNLTFSQITVTQNANAQTLAQLLTGSGVTISNYTISGDARASGTFNNVSSNLGLNQGVVLSTGMVTSISQPATNFASTQFTNSGDVQLGTLTTGTIYDVSILQFDITPQGSTLQFNYVFASEEYPQFVCSPYNDVFGFFITGPNPSGGSYTSTNLATLPNSTLPVCINSVNPGVSGTYMGNTWSSGNCLSLGNSNLYVNNLTPNVNPNIVYNGMTTVLTATASVVPCQTYHLKIAIADVGDRIYDSGVFLQAYSFTSTPYTTSIKATVNDPGYTSTYKGCVDGTFTVSISAPQVTNTKIALAVTGTATNGVDYNFIPDSVIIPAGQTSVTIPMNPVQDNIVTPTKTVVVSAVNPCTGATTASDSLTIKDDPIATLSVNDSVLCKGQSAQFTATGGFTYNWSPAAGLSSDTASSPIATPQSTTYYSVGVIVGSCTTTLSQRIYVSNPSVSIAASPDDTICTAGNIQLTATVIGGFSPYTYLWNNNNTASSIAASTTGNYSIVVTDSSGCTATTSKNIIISNLSATGNVVPVSCFGDNNGAITLNVTGANGPYNYKWNDGPASSNRSNLLGGNYTVTVTNSVACTATATFNISQPASSLSAIAAPHNNLCNGDSTGSISLTVTGGVQPYTYIWSNTATTQNVANISAGTYSTTVTDFGGCSVTASATVTQPAPITASAIATNEKCAGDNNGSIQLTPANGFAPYTYSWSNNQTTQNINNLTKGNYTVTVADVNHCSMTKTISITQPAGLIVTATPTNPGCTGNSTGSISLTVNGGTPNYTFLWSNNSTNQNISGVNPGTYSTTVTDNNGCTATSSATIAPPGSLTISVAQNNVTCNGANNGSISLQAAGGVSPYTYVWNGVAGSSSKNNLSTGAYDVTVSDVNSCSATLSLAISQPAALNLSLFATNVSCFGAANGSIRPTVAGGTTPYTYSWTGGINTTNLNNLTTGIYNVTVSDSNSCTITGSATITQPATALNSVATSTNITCFGNANGTINLNTTGGTGPYTYNWGGNVTIQNRNNLTAGNYTVTVTDANSCTFTTSANITQPNSLTVIPTQVNVSCNGDNTGSINLQVSGGTIPYNYSWNGGGNTGNRANLSAGNYQVTVSDANSCSSTLSVIISQPNTLSLSAVATNVACFGANNGSINLSVAGGTSPYTYNWGGGITSQNRANLGVGNYNVTVTDSNFCSATTSAAITQPLAALSASPSITNVTCNGSNTGAITISVTGGTIPYSFDWGSGITSQNRSNLTAGNYDVTVTDAGSCTASASATISQPATAMTIAPAISDVSCNGGNNGSINLNINGGSPPYAYNWSNSSNTKKTSNLIAGSYSVTVQDTKGCVNTSAFTISQPPVLTVAPNVSDASCFGSNNGQIKLTVTGGTIPYHYKWNTGAITSELMQLTAGAYSVAVVDSHNCVANATFSITQPTPMQISATPVSVLCSGAQNGGVNISVTGGAGGYSYTWSNHSASANLANAAAGNYSLTITDANSCTVTASETVSSPPAITLASSQTNELCHGASVATASVSASGGTGKFTYNWSNSATSQQLTGIKAGNYSVTVSDANACTATKVITITEPPLITLTENHTNLLCNGSDNGSITLSVTGGIPGYHYLWSNGDTTRNIANVPAGSYSVDVTDSNGCFASLNLVTVTQPAMINVAITAGNISCYGSSTGKATTDVTGGTAPYHFLWNTNSTGQNLLNENTGTYTVTVTDANGCTGTGTTTINTLPPMNVTGNTNPLPCSNAYGDITLNVNSGTPPYAFRWSNNAETENLGHVHPGIYWVTVSDANNCTFDTSFTITDLHTFDVKASGGGTIDLGQTLTLNAVSTGSALTTYNWIPSTGLACADCAKTGAQPGETTIYTVIATDTNGCTANDTVSIDVISDHNIWLPNAFTPNGDGNNDYFQMYGNLEGVRDMQIMIFDRWGEEVFESTASDFKWDGQYKGKAAPAAVYVFVLKFAFLDGSENAKKGSINLIR